jgi:hypothetical protein
MSIIRLMGMLRLMGIVGRLLGGNVVAATILVGVMLGRRIGQRPECPAADIAALYNFRCIVVVGHVNSLLVPPI